jgi:hypothetical protein
MERPIQLTLGQDGRLSAMRGIEITRLCLDISYIGSVGPMQPVTTFLALRINGSVFLEFANSSMQYIGALNHDGQPSVGTGSSKLTFDLSLAQLERIEQQRLGGPFTLRFDIYGHSVEPGGTSTYLVSNGMTYRVEASEWADVLTRSAFNNMMILLPRNPSEHASDNCKRAFDSAAKAGLHLQNGAYRNAVAEGRSAAKRLVDELGPSSNSPRNQTIAERFADVAKTLLSVANAANHTEEDPLDDHHWTREETIAFLGPLFALLGYVTARPERPV